MRKGCDGGAKNGGKKNGEKKKKKRLMIIVATTSLPAVDCPYADRWNAARSCQKHIKRIAARPGDDTTTTFTLPKHIESWNKICQFFTAISQKYFPLNIKTLPVWVQAKFAFDLYCHSSLPDHWVWKTAQRKEDLLCPERHSYKSPSWIPFWAHHSNSFNLWRSNQHLVSIIQDPYH